MALQIWLPLNGDTKNQGLSGSTITSNAITEDTNGKIGKCYSFNGSTSHIQIDWSNFPSILNNDFSICMWIYHNDNNDRSILFGNWNLTGAFFSFEKYANNNIRFYWNNNPDINLENAIPPATWTHLVVTKKESTVKLYINGVLGKTSTATLNGSVPSTATTFRIGRDGRSDATGLNGKINDFRVYDHALSVKEVKEIAKALVLHYPMNIQSTTNLALGTNTRDTSLNAFNYSEQTGGTTKTIEEDEFGIPCLKITRNSTAHSGWHFFNYSRLDVLAIKPNTTYTISFDAIASGNGFISLTGFINGNATNSISASCEDIQISFNANKWSHIVMRTTTKSSFEGISVGGQVVYMYCSYMTNTNVWIKLKNMKVEEGTKDTEWCPHPSDALYTELGYGSNIERDTSGYGRDGTIIGAISRDSGAPRYDLSTKFSSGSHISISSLNASGFANNYTFSWWGKFTNCDVTMMWGYANGNRLNLYAVKNSSTDSFFWNTGDGSGNPFYISPNAYADNNWHHFAVTGDGTVTKLYIDGIFKANAKYYRGITGTSIYLNGWTNTEDYNFNGNLSDFRIYATALSAEDILELYHTSGSVDKSGNIHTYEYKEVS